MLRIKGKRLFCKFAAQSGLFLHERTLLALLFIQWDEWTSHASPSSVKIHFKWQLNTPPYSKKRKKTCHWRHRGPGWTLHGGKYVYCRLHNNNAESHFSLLGVAGFKYACLGIKPFMIYSFLVCLCAFFFPLSGSPSSLRNHLNISFGNFYVTVAAAPSFVFPTSGGGSADVFSFWNKEGGSWWPLSKRLLGKYWKC